jgi:hypothetical protein
VADGTLRAGRDDVLVGGRVVRCEGQVHGRLHALDGELLAVELQLIAADVCPPEQLAASVHRRLGGTLRPPNSRELSLGLGAAAAVEELLVDVQLDAVGAEAVGEPDGEARRNGRTRQPEAADGAERQLRVELARIDSRRDQLVLAELLFRVNVEEPEPAQPGGLHRAGEDVPVAVLLGVEERIRHAERHRLPHVGGPEGVGVDQHRVWHSRAMLTIAGGSLSLSRRDHGYSPARWQPRTRETTPRSRSGQRAGSTRARRGGRSRRSRSASTPRASRST